MSLNKEERKIVAQLIKKFSEPDQSNEFYYEIYQVNRNNNYVSAEFFSYMRTMFKKIKNIIKETSPYKISSQQLTSNTQHYLEIILDNYYLYQYNFLRNHGSIDLGLNLEKFINTQMSRIYIPQAEISVATETPNPSLPPIKKSSLLKQFKSLFSSKKKIAPERQSTNEIPVGKIVPESEFTSVPMADNAVKIIKPRKKSQIQPTALDPANMSEFEITTPELEEQIVKLALKMNIKNNFIEDRFYYSLDSLVKLFTPYVKISLDKTVRRQIIDPQELRDFVRSYILDIRTNYTKHIFSEEERIIRIEAGINTADDNYIAHYSDIMRPPSPPIDPTEYDVIHHDDQSPEMSRVLDAIGYYNEVTDEDIKDIEDNIEKSKQIENYPIISQERIDEIKQLKGTRRGMTNELLSDQEIINEMIPRIKQDYPSVSDQTIRNAILDIINSIPNPHGAGRNVIKRKGTTSNWVLFVKKFAQDHGLSYACALSNPQVSVQYKAWKKSHQQMSKSLPTPSPKLTRKQSSKLQAVNFYKSTPQLSLSNPDEENYTYLNRPMTAPKKISEPPKEIHHIVTISKPKPKPKKKKIIQEFKIPKEELKFIIKEKLVNLNALKKQLRVRPSQSLALEIVNLENKINELKNML